MSRFRRKSQPAAFWESDSEQLVGEGPEDKYSEREYSGSDEQSVLVQVGIIIGILALLGLCIAAVVGIYSIKNDIGDDDCIMIVKGRGRGRGRDDDDDCPVVEPCPECENCALRNVQPQCRQFDPNSPPPNWPGFIPGLEWNTRGNLPIERLCTLTPPLININANASLYAYQQQSIPNEPQYGPGVGGQKVIYIDVRTPEEIYWVGVPTQANSVTLKTSQVLIPDFFITRLVNTGAGSPEAIEFTVGGVPHSYAPSEIASISMSDIVYNVPVEYVDANTGVKTLNPLWGKQADAILRETGADRIIFYCRSGQRSSIGCYYEFCPFEQLFPGILGGQMFAFEVESAIENGRGGFQGTDYSNTFNGYRGYPERYTVDSSVSPSAAFMDAGLPMDTGKLPITVTVQPSTGATLSIDSIPVPSWAESQP